MCRIFGFSIRPSVYEAIKQTLKELATMTRQQKQAALRLALRVKRVSTPTTRTYAVLQDGTVEFIKTKEVTSWKQ